MGFVINFSDVEEGESFEALSPGEYRATIDLIEFVSPNIQRGKQWPYLSITFRLSDPDGRKAWGNYSMSPKALWKFLELLNGLGIDKTNFAIGLVPDDDYPDCYTSADKGFDWGADSEKGNATVVGFELVDGKVLDIRAMPVTVTLGVEADQNGKDRNTVEKFIADGVQATSDTQKSAAQQKTRDNIGSRTRPVGSARKTRPGVN